MMRDPSREEASRELAKVIQSATAASESSALRKRKDLVGFFDALFAAAIAFGLSVFYENYKNALLQSQANKSVVLLYILPAIAVLAAVAFVLDDWRQARWLILDYGYRTLHSQRILRFWIDGLLVVLAFFITASAFSHPATYLFLLGFYLLFAWIWVRLLKWDIKRYIVHKGAYPHNSLGLRIESTAKPDVRDRVINLDYRIKSKLGDMVFCVALFVVGVLICRMERAQSVLEWDVQCWASIGPALSLIILKAICHHNKGVSIEAIRLRREQ
jgi:hypothetical protein